MDEELIKAARHGKGVIRLEPDSADEIKEVVQKVSTITKSDEDELHFEGKRVAEGHGYALVINAFDIFECPNGYLLHCYMDKSKNWAVTGRTLKHMLHAAEQVNKSVAKRAHGELVKKSMLSIHQH